MTVVSFAIQKGGTAKTTTAVNLAAWIAKKGKDVLLIDLDPQANATECLVDPASVSLSIKNVLMGDKGILDPGVIYHSSSILGLDFIPSKPAMLIDEYFGRYSGLMPFILRDGLGSVKSKYAYIMCDCPPNLLHFTKNALFASDYIVIPLEPEPLALQGLEQLVNGVIPDVKKQNPNLKVGGVVIVHRAPRTRKYLPEQARRTIDSLLPGLRFGWEVPLDVNLAEMRNYNQPVCVYAPDSPGSLYYERLADEFLSRIPP